MRPIDVSLAVALTKSGLDDVVAATTELGVARVIPVRTDARWCAGTRVARPARVDRFRTVAREAAMQSRRATVPVIDDVVALKALVGRPGLVVADPSGLARRPRSSRTARPAGRCSSDPKAASLRTSCPGSATPAIVSLGPYVLRASTAPTAAVAVLLAEAARLGPE